MECDRKEFPLTTSVEYISHYKPPFLMKYQLNEKKFNEETGGREGYEWKQGEGWWV